MSAVLYTCSVCGRGEAEGVTRDTLVVKKVRFETMGSGSRVLRTRVLGWLCPQCLVNDEVWKQESKRGHMPLKGKISG